MAKGIKMDSCRKKNSGNEVFPLKTLSKDDNGNLLCQYCNAEVTYVSAHPKSSSKKSISAYLRLRPHDNHAPECKNTVKVAVKDVVSNSLAVENITPIFKPQQRETYLFRLNILKEAQDIIRKVPADRNQNIDDVESLFIGRDFVKNGKQLASYFHSAVGLARIRTLIEDSGDINNLEELVKIEYQDCCISWNSFYYEHSRYVALANRLEKESITHPIAMIVKIKHEPKLYKDTGHNSFAIQCFAFQDKTSDKGRTIVPRIRTFKEKIAKSFIIDKTYIVIGGVSMKKPDKGEPNSFRNINIWVNHEAQFKIDIEDS